MTGSAVLLVKPTSPASGIMWAKTLHVNSTAGDYWPALQEALLMTSPLELCSAQASELQHQYTCELCAWELEHS